MSMRDTIKRAILDAVRGKNVVYYTEQSVGVDAEYSSAWIDLSVFDTADKYTVFVEYDQDITLHIIWGAVSQVEYFVHTYDLAVTDAPKMLVVPRMGRYMKVKVVNQGTVSVTVKIYVIVEP